MIHCILVLKFNIFHDVFVFILMFFVFIKCELNKINVYIQGKIVSSDENKLNTLNYDILIKY